MSNSENRVLNRMGAREVTEEELEQVAAAGGPNHTLACTIPTSFKNATSTTCDVES
jgi:hypothetical protein